MKSTRWTFKLRDLGQAIVLMLVGNILALVMSLPEDTLPTWPDLLSNLITSVKFAVIPYLLKNFVTNDVAVAQKTIADAKKKL